MMRQFKYLSGYISVNYVRKIYTEGSTSLLINHITSVVLFASCVLVSSIQYFGDPIQCVQDKKDEDAAINERVMNNFCFISSTYTISQDRLGYGCETNRDIQFSRGIGPNNGNVTRHTYYVWVPLVLFFQAFTFLLPYSCWEYCEGGLIGKLLNGLLGSGAKVSDTAVYFERTLRTHRFFCFAWLFYDVLSFSIALGNFALTDSLLGGRFWALGSTILAPDSGKCGIYLDHAFPKLTKCTFYKFGSGGSMQNFDSLCVMALNVVNEKIYTILWFWFVLLVPASFLSFLLKIGFLACVKCLSKRRLRQLAAKSWVKILIGCPNLKNSTSLSLFVNRFALSDWVFFACFVCGMRPDIYDKFVNELQQLLQEHGTAPEEKV